MNSTLSNLTLCYEGIQRVYRNAVLGHVRSRMQAVFGESASTKIKNLFQKEWTKIRAAAIEARDGGHVAAPLLDELDILGVNHFFNIFEKYPNELLEHIPEDTRIITLRNLIGWMREVKAYRDPLSHPAAEDLPYEDAFRLMDSARRVLELLGHATAVDEMRQLADRLADRATEITLTSLPSPTCAPPPRRPLEARLPPRDTVVAEFVGRSEELGQLRAWFNDNARPRWVLSGDGGKGKSSLAYTFAEQVRDEAPDPYRIVLWISAKKRRFLMVDPKMLSPRTSSI